VADPLKTFFSPELVRSSLLGFGAKPLVGIEDVRFKPKRVAVGGRVAVTFALRSAGRTTQRLLVDLRVHFMKANGKTSPKVFKLKRIELLGRGRVALASRISLAVHTTRQPRPGRHDVEVIINGEAIPIGFFDVNRVPAGRGETARVRPRRGRSRR
jgi:hypothetical protein